MNERKDATLSLKKVFMNIFIARNDRPILNSFCK